MKTFAWKYISDQIYKEINEGRYLEGQKLPTENEYSLRFGVNRHTIRRALNELIRKSYIYSRKGSGFYVSEKKTIHFINQRPRFTKSLVASGDTPLTKIIRLEYIKPNEEEAKNLKIKKEEMVIFLEGIGYRNNTPICIYKKIFPRNRIPGLMASFKKNSSISKALFDSGIKDYIRSYSIISSKLTNPVEAFLLKCKQGEPLICTKNLNVNNKKEPIEFGYTLFMGSRVEIYIENN